MNAALVFVLFSGGLIDVGRGVAYVNVQDTNAARAWMEDDPRGPGYLDALGTLAAIDLATGKRRWAVPEVSGAFHLAGDTVIAWANDAEHATIAVLDAKSGKRLRAFKLFPVAPAKPIAPGSPCTLDVPARSYVQHRFGGDDEVLWMGTEGLHCSAGRARGGARMTDEALAEDAKRCVSSKSATQWSLATGQESKREKVPRPAPSLEQLGSLTAAGVQLSLEAGELVARKNGKRLWGVARAVHAPAIRPPCPAPP